MADLSTSVSEQQKNKESAIQVKQEQKDDDESSQGKYANRGSISHTIPRTTVQSQSQVRNASFTKVLHSTPPQETHPPPIDAASIRGAFGWTTISGVNLPFILRGEERFLSVRMVESKIINRYADSLPWMVFTCTNIKSYYITENEARLLNEINGHHCEFQFGYRAFTTRDVVVRLQDTCMFYEFLETCRTKLFPSAGNPAFKDRCGFVILNKSLIPFLRKGANRHVPMISVQQQIPISLVESTSISEWDLSYLRFLCNVTGLDLRKFKVGGSMCCLDDLCKEVFGETDLQEWWPDPSQLLYVKNGKAPLAQWERFLRSSEVAQPIAHQQSLYRNDDLQKLREKGNITNHFCNNSDSMYERSNTEAHQQQTIKGNFESGLLPQAMHLSSLSSRNMGWQQEKDEPIMYAPIVNGHLAAVPASGYYPPGTSNSSQTDCRLSRINNSMLPIPLSHNSLLRDAEAYHNDSINTEEEGIYSSSRAKCFPPPPPLVRLGDKTVDDNMGTSGYASALERPQSSQQHIGHPPPLHSSRQVIGDQQNTSVHTNHCKNNEQMMPLIVGIHSFSDESLDAKRNSISGSLPELTCSINDSQDNSSCQQTSMDMDSAAVSVFARAMKSREPVKESFQKDFHLRALLAKDDKPLSDRYASSPRMHFTVGPPPHYPTPPQSSPLQPLTVQMPLAAAGALLPSTNNLTDGLTSRMQDIIDLCSPPPSPESRVLSSPSRSQQMHHPLHRLSGTNPLSQEMNASDGSPYIVQMVDIEGHQIPAVNMEPHAYNSQLVAPIADVGKLFPSVSIQSFVFVLQSVLGVRLHECDRLLKHVLTKSGQTCIGSGRLVSVTDLKAYMPQLKYMFKRYDKTHESSCEDGRADTGAPASKRWCSNGRES